MNSNLNNFVNSLREKPPIFLQLKIKKKNSSSMFAIAGIAVVVVRSSSNCWTLHHHDANTIFYYRYYCYCATTLHSSSENMVLIMHVMSHTQISERENRISSIFVCGFVWCASERDVCTFNTIMLYILSRVS